MMRVVINQQFINSLFVQLCDYMHLRGGPLMEYYQS